jgi:hypothetical protein
MTKKYADVRITFTVAFDDDEGLDLKDQAIEAAMEKTGLHYEADIEVLGEVRDTDTL